MRLLPCLALAILAAGSAAADTYSPRPGDIVTPSPSGLTLSNPDGTTQAQVDFGTGFHTTMQAIVTIFDHNTTISFPEECGAGPMVSADIPGQITLMFQEDRLVGWMLNRGAALITDTGLSIGMSTDTLVATGPVEFFESGLGTEFSRDGTYGVLNETGDRIEAIWSGTNCIFR
ncbi:hypothetical protein V8J82_12330 [Gymnodinialimonas sp. 2305UL16-5]|uniref:hypothetical protein n=1 Tax=Gymnodinialimonas mytili TaxID=3126503 RepID=UPI00309D9186